MLTSWEIVVGLGELSLSTKGTGCQGGTNWISTRERGVNEMGFWDGDEWVIVNYEQLGGKGFH